MTKPGCTPERTELIAHLLRTGQTISAAFRVAGLNPSTHTNWMRRAREISADPGWWVEPVVEGDDFKIKEFVHHGAAPGSPEALYLEYMAAFEHATAFAEIRVAANLMDAATSKKDWRAAAWWLERRGDKEEWGKPDKLEVSGPGGKALPAGTGSGANVVVLTTEEKNAAVLDALAITGVLNVPSPPKPEPIEATRDDEPVEVLEGELVEGPPDE